MPKQQITIHKPSKVIQKYAYVYNIYIYLSYQQRHRLRNWMFVAEFWTGACTEVKHLSDEQKEVVGKLSAPSQIDVQDTLCWGDPSTSMENRKKSQVSSFIISFFDIKHGTCEEKICPPYQYGFHPYSMQERRCLYAAMDRRFAQNGVVPNFQTHPNRVCQPKFWHASTISWVAMLALFTANKIILACQSQILPRSWWTSMLQRLAITQRSLELRQNQLMPTITRFCMLHCPSGLNCWKSFFWQTRCASAAIEILMFFCKHFGFAPS